MFTSTFKKVPNGSYKVSIHHPLGLIGTPLKVLVHTHIRIYTLAWFLVTVGPHLDSVRFFASTKNLKKLPVRGTFFTTAPGVEHA